MTERRNMSWRVETNGHFFSLSYNYNYCKITLICENGKVKICHFVMYIFSYVHIFLKSTITPRKGTQWLLFSFFTSYFPLHCRLIATKLVWFIFWLYFTIQQSNGGPGATDGSPHVTPEVAPEAIIVEEPEEEEPTNKKGLSEKYKVT